MVTFSKSGRRTRGPDSMRMASVSSLTLPCTGSATPTNAFEEKETEIIVQQGADQLRSVEERLVAGSCLTYDEQPNWPGGWRPWTCLVGCFFLMFNSWGLVNAYGTFSSYYLQHLFPGIDLLLLNLIGSTQSFVVLGLSFVVGRLLDAGHARQIVAVETVLVTLGMFMVSVVNHEGKNGQGNYGSLVARTGFCYWLGPSLLFRFKFSE